MTVNGDGHASVRGQPAAGAATTDRLKRVDDLVADVARAASVNGMVDDAVIIGQHPDLMPELGDRLHDLHLIFEAEQKARESPARPTRDPRELLVEEELHFLRATLKTYEVLAPVRYGGQGAVYRARQRGTQRIVALKLLLDGPLASERQRHRFEREIELVSRLRHPNIVTVFDSGVIRGRNFYAMEFIEGCSIDDFMVYNDLTPEQIVRLVIKVCQAVHHAHQNGVIHRDLNPSNILVDEAGEPRVYDFGLAKDLWSDNDGVCQTATGQACGTLPYLSPEALGAGDGTIDVRSDVYSIGLILYGLLTETFPYPAHGDPGAVRNAILQTEPMPLLTAIALGAANRAPGLGAINRDLEQILAKALAKVKNERYQTAADLADDLERWLRKEAVTARSGSGWYRVRKALRRHRIAVGFAAVVAAALAVLSVTVALSWWRIGQERDRAVAAAGEASENFDIALTEIEESVRSLPGGLAVRDRLIQRLAGRLPALEALVESSAALEPTRLRMLEKRADLALEQGRRAEAADEYRQFLDRNLERVKQAPDDTEILAGVIRGYRKLGESSETPSAWFDQGIETGEDVVRTHSDASDARYELCRIRLARESLLRNSLRHRDALQDAERVLELCSNNAARERSAGTAWRRTAADALTCKGLDLREGGDAAVALETLTNALRAREQIAAETPADTSARHALLKAYSHVGKLYREVGDLEQAKVYLRQACEAATLLTKLDPQSVTWGQDVYAAHHLLASLCIDTGTMEEAATQMEAAASVAEAWAARDKGKDARTAAYHFLMLQGKFRRIQGHWDEARAFCQTALSSADALLAQEPESPARMADVANACDALAYCYRHAGDPEPAVPLGERAYELCQRVRRLEPGEIGTALDVIQVQTNLAASHASIMTAEHRLAAESLLAEAERALTELNSAGQVAGSERRYESLTRTIRGHRAALSGLAPTSPDVDASTTSPPASQP